MDRDPGIKELIGCFRHVTFGDGTAPSDVSGIRTLYLRHQHTAAHGIGPVGGDDKIGPKRFGAAAVVYIFVTDDDGPVCIREVRHPLGRLVDRLAFLLGGGRRFGAVLASESVEVGPQAIVEGTPTGHLERPLPEAFYVRVLVDELNARAVKGIRLLGEIVGGEKRLHLGAGADTGGVAGSK